MSPTTFQWLMAFIGGGLLLASIKGLIMLGETLQLIRQHDDMLKDHADRIHNIEQVFIGGAHK